MSGFTFLYRLIEYSILHKSITYPQYTIFSLVEAW